MKKLLTLMLLIPSLSAMAADLIESRDGQGNRSTFYIEGDRAHIEMPQQQGYMVLDVNNNSMKAVIHKQRAVMDMSDLLASDAAGSSGQQVDADARSKGPGPKIAGYETKQYDIYANGQYCGSTFVSVNAVRDLGLKKFARAMQTMNSSIQNTVTGITGTGMNRLLGPCEQAEMQLSDRIQDIGFPLRFINQNRQLVSEVTKISRNVRLPANAFKIPADYRVMNPNKMMKDAMKQMPAMQDMIKNMPPEAMEMMRKRMQEMYQQ